MILEESYYPMNSVSDFIVLETPHWEGSDFEVSDFVGSMRGRTMKDVVADNDKETWVDVYLISNNVYYQYGAREQDYASPGNVQRFFLYMYTRMVKRTAGTDDELAWHVLNNRGSMTIMDQKGSVHF